MAANTWAASRVTALPEFWALVAEHSGLVGAWRLTRVCKAAREGARYWLRTLPGLVVCGELVRDSDGDDVITSEVWRLDLGELQWQEISSLVRSRAHHACCAVRGTVVVLGGQDVEYPEEEGDEDEEEDLFTDSVETLGYDQETGENIFKPLPALSCGVIASGNAVVIDESESDQGQVLLIGELDDTEDETISSVQKVDLATGVCTPQPALLCGQSLTHGRTIARLPDGRVVCVGYNKSAEIFEPPEQGSSTEAGWQWRELPAMSVQHFGCGGCVLSDGRFEVFGGLGSISMSSCEVLTLDGDEQWEPLLPMHEARHGFACAAVGGCVIIAGGISTGNSGHDAALQSVDVYEEALGRWRRLPCSLPHHGGVGWIRGALMR
jgi:hypothetical protein